MFIVSMIMRGRRSGGIGRKLCENLRNVRKPSCHPCQRLFSSIPPVQHVIPLDKPNAGTKPSSKKCKDTEAGEEALNSALERKSVADAMIAVNRLRTLGYILLPLPSFERLLRVIAKEVRIDDIKVVMEMCPGNTPSITSLYILAEPLLVSGNTQLFSQYLDAYLHGVKEPEVCAILDTIIYARAKRFAAQTDVTVAEAEGMRNIVDMLDAFVGSMHGGLSSDEGEATHLSSSHEDEGQWTFSHQMGLMIFSTRLMQLTEAELATPGNISAFLGAFTLLPPLVEPSPDVQTCLIPEDKDDVLHNEPMSLNDLTRSITQAQLGSGSDMGSTYSHVLLEGRVARVDVTSEVQYGLAMATQGATEGAIQDMLHVTLGPYDFGEEFDSSDMELTGEMDLEDGMVDSGFQHGSSAADIEWSIDVIEEDDGSDDGEHQGADHGHSDYDHSLGDRHGEDFLDPPTEHMIEIELMNVPLSQLHGDDGRFTSRTMANAGLPIYEMNDLTAQLGLHILRDDLMLE